MKTLQRLRQALKTSLMAHKPTAAHRGGQPQPDLVAPGCRRDARAEHLDMHQAFAARCAVLGIPYDHRLFWYHTVDLGQGLVTPGSFDYRCHLDHFGFPADMTNLQVLDVGSATGYFAFEFERRGAKVTSVELPSLRAWDRFPGEAADQIVAKMQTLMPFHQVLSTEAVTQLFEESTEQALYEFLLDAPFKFCHRVLQSRVVRRYGTIYALADLDLGGPFDLVFVGDLLLHTINPLAALAAAATQCRGDLVISQPIPIDPATHQPALLYTGGDRQGQDAAVWWLPNLAWFETILRRLGFASVQVAGQFTHTVRPSGHPSETAVLLARRRRS